MGGPTGCPGGCSSAPLHLSKSPSPGLLREAKGGLSVSEFDFDNGKWWGFFSQFCQLEALYLKH